MKNAFQLGDYGMKDDRYRVHLVVNSEYGERLRDLPDGEPVWVVDSPCNHPVIRVLWQERTSADPVDGITSFTFNPKGTPGEWLIRELSAIDMHHGEYSHDPPYSVLNVIGAECSEDVREAFEAFGFNHFETTAEGFVATRPQD